MVFQNKLTPYLGAGLFVDNDAINVGDAVIIAAFFLIMMVFFSKLVSVRYFMLRAKLAAQFAFFYP